MGKRKNRKRIPKRFASDFINTYKGVDANMVAAYSIFNNRARVQTMHGKLPIHKEGLDGKPIVGNTWTEPVPKTKSEQRYRGPVTPFTHEYIEDGVKHVQIRNKYEEGRTPEEIDENTRKVWMKTPRGEALDKATVERNSKTLYKIFQSERQQKVVEYHSIFIKKLPGLVLKLHFQGTDFIFEQVTEKHRAYSKTYRGRDAAMLAYNLSAISWSVLEDL